jgi:hypothetical protein
MFKEIFEEIVAKVSLANAVDEAHRVIESSGLSKVFGQFENARAEGREKFASSEAVRGDVRDIARLLLLGQAIKPIVALEIGSGYSTAALAYIISQSQRALASHDFPDRNERSFVVESLDESEDYIAVTRERLPAQLAERVRFHHSTVTLTKVHDRYATLFDSFPNCLPDLIYLDGPSQLAASNTVNGFTLRGAFRMPMSADILLIEHFLEPGCVILVDGRTANVRFLIANFQRSWLHHHDTEGDVHLLMMNEHALGSVNRRKLEARGIV